MSKKVLSVMLALVMVLSVFSISAFAGVNARYEEIDEDAGETQIAHTQKWSLVASEEPDADGNYTVNVVLETNYNTGVISFDIVADGAELVNAEKGSAITYDADVAFFEGMEHIDIIPNPTLAQAAVDAPIFAAGSVVAKLTYKLTGTSATLKLMNDSKCAENPGGALFAVRLDNKTLASNTVYYGQRVIDAEGNDIALGDEIASVELGQVAAEPADLAIEEAYADSGIIIDKNKKLGDAYDGVVYGMVLPGNGTSQLNQAFYTERFCDTNGNEIVPKMTVLGRGFGTGTVLQVMEDGIVTKKYIVVIFGDTTGDGIINVTDSSRIYAEYRANGTLQLVQILASNIEVAGRNDAQKIDSLYKTASTDYTKFQSLLNNRVDIQVSMATAHSTYHNVNYA